MDQQTTTNQKVKQPLQGDMREAIKRSADGYPLLGYCVYWSISEFKITYREFMERLEQAGLPSDLATENNLKSALIQSLKDATKGLKNKFHRKVLDDDKRAVFAIVNSEVDAQNTDVNFSTETKATLNKEHMHIVVEGPDKELIEKHFEQNIGAMDQDRFRNVVLKYLNKHCSAVSIRDRGGVYFVPSTMQTEFDLLGQYFSKFPGCSLDIVPIIDTQEAKHSMWKALVGDVQAELVSLQDDLKDMTVDTQKRSIEHRVEKFKSLRDKVEMYEILLNGTAKELKDSLDQVGTKLHDMLAKD